MQLLKVCAAASIAAVSFALALCPPAHAADNNKNNTINAFYYSLNDLFVNQLSISLQDRALSLGLKIKKHDANDDLMLQIAQIDATVSASNNNYPILVNPVDTQNGTAALLAAKENNVPIIFFNRSPDEKVLTSYKDAWYIGTDPNTAAQYQAKIVEDYILSHKEADKNGDGYINYILLKGEVGHQDTNARSGNFLRTILENDKIKVKPLASMNANWSEAEGLEVMNDFINRNGLDSVELIVSNNDAMALGAIRALQANGYNLSGAKANKDKYIPVVGIDAVPRALDAIEDGTMIGTVLNDADSMAKAVMEIADAYIEGKEVNQEQISYKIENQSIQIPYVQITSKNVNTYNN